MAKRVGMIRDLPLIQINIPEDLKRDLDAVAKEFYTSNMDYVRSVLRTDTCLLYTSDAADE